MKTYSEDMLDYMPFILSRLKSNSSDKPIWYIWYIFVYNGVAANVLNKKLHVTFVLKQK